MKCSVVVFIFAVLPVMACGGGLAKLEGRINVAAPVTPDQMEPYVPPITSEQISEVIKKRNSNFDGCFEVSLRGLGNVSGQLHIRFRIEPGGSVSDVWVTKNELTEEVSECITSVFKELAFPFPEDAKSFVVEYPFKFTPAE